MTDEKKPHPMLTKRDYKRHEGWQLVLDLCNIQACNSRMIEEQTNLSSQTIGNYQRALELEGYLHVESVPVGTFNQPSKFYRTLIANFPIEDLLPISAKINNKMKERGIKSGKKPSGYVSQAVEIKLPPNVTMVKERHVTSRRKTEYRGIGSSMGMAW